MEQEIRTFDHSQKEKWNSQMVRCKQDCTSLSQDFDREKGIVQRKDLFLGAIDAANVCV
jgi:hypothetical protein